MVVHARPVSLQLRGRLSQESKLTGSLTSRSSDVAVCLPARAMHDPFHAFAGSLGLDPVIFFPSELERRPACLLNFNRYIIHCTSHKNLSITVTVDLFGLVPYLNKVGRWLPPFPFRRWCHANLDSRSVDPRSLCGRPCSVSWFLKLSLGAGSSFQWLEAPLSNS